MKKQLFLLSLFSLFMASEISLIADSCCSTSCSTSCCSASSGDCQPCSLEHGHTYLRTDNEFQNGAPVFVAMANSDILRNLDEDDKHGNFQVTVFGGKNTKQSEAAAYFFPYGHQTYTVTGDVSNTLQTFAGVAAMSTIDQNAAGATGKAIQFPNRTTTGATGAAAPATTVYDATNLTADGTSILQADPATFQFDGNKDTSIIRPWNFGITYAALFEPTGSSASGSLLGTGLVTNPTFESTLCPKYKYSHVGAGFSLNYQFSEDKNGFWGRISTAVENVKSNVKLNENVVTEKTELNATNFPAQNYSTTANHYGFDFGVAGVKPSPQILTTTAAATPTGSIYEAYINGTTGTGFPTDDSDITDNIPAPQNMTEAFNQSSWKYGKIGCDQSITRLADIELCLGYQWYCGDCASTNWYIGLVIPTGNKPCANHLAAPVVGNGQHVGIMAGSCFELLLSNSDSHTAWYRVDMNGRYLFRNTQKRSFDLKGKEWSRYMMVWANEDAYTAAVTAANTNFDGRGTHAYTPGINVFTSDMYVKPRTQARINSAVHFRAESFRAELGWNLMARQKECVQFSCDWTTAPAFADASFVGGLGLNNNRTIYNDSQLTAINQIDTFKRNNSTNVFTLAETALSAANYEDFAITTDDVNFDSCSNPAQVIYTPYLTLGYGWNSDCKPHLSVGAQYEFTAGNAALNHWMVWGKFDLAF